MEKTMNSEKERAVVKISMPLAKVLPFVVERVRNKATTASSMASNFMQNNFERERGFFSTPLENLNLEALSEYSSEIGSLVEILEDAIYELTENRNVLDGLARSLSEGRDKGR
jgi:hypothetical protein